MRKKSLRLWEPSEELPSGTDDVTPEEAEFVRLLAEGLELGEAARKSGLVDRPPETLRYPERYFEVSAARKLARPEVRKRLEAIVRGKLAAAAARAVARIHALAESARSERVRLEANIAILQAAVGSAAKAESAEAKAGVAIAIDLGDRTIDVSQTKTSSEA